MMSRKSMIFMALEKTKSSGGRQQSEHVFIKKPWFLEMLDWVILEYYKDGKLG